MVPLLCLCLHAPLGVRQAGATAGRGREEAVEGLPLRTLQAPGPTVAVVAQSWTLAGVAWAPGRC